MDQMVGLLCSLLLALLNMANGSIQCNYCGIRKLCDTKYDPGELFAVIDILN
jgi:hypothetical protein